ncbi:MAG: lipoyl(octanoyl) transferase LipB, partial [Candidatus Marinimicrobia bacterium]|nr:lipoyl(octanoyl) transferase LipB [Candidatus Neomarinimicrobiota bacterium]
VAEAVSIEPVTPSIGHAGGLIDLSTMDREQLFTSISKIAGSHKGDSPVHCFYIGRQPYGPIWQLQKALHQARAAGDIGDVVLLLEHEPVYTLGKNARADHLLPGYPSDAEVIATDRGGDITFHGPGQLVGYPIVDLRDHRQSVTWYMRGLEGVLIRALATYGVAGSRKPGLTGVWIDDLKVAALGIRLAKWTTMHGFALNIAVDHKYLAGMVPCGIDQFGVANLNEHLPATITTYEAASRVEPVLRAFLGG